MGLKKYFRRYAIRAVRRDFRRACTAIAYRMADACFKPDEDYIAEIYRSDKPSLVRAYRKDREEYRAYGAVMAGAVVSFSTALGAITQTDLAVRVPCMVAVPLFMGLMMEGLNALSPRQRAIRKINRAHIQHDLVMKRRVTDLVHD